MCWCTPYIFVLDPSLHMRVSYQNMRLVMSTDAKPRLKWTPELHQRFVDAVNLLGGGDKATPKGLMRVMGIPGLTLYHLKSHLQKFRLGKSQQPLTSIEDKKEVILDADYKEVQSISDVQINKGISKGSHDQINENLRIAQALQLQMEVQRKLHEQIEVQRHLQLRIEAQGKYLQSVLKKAQETLSGYNSSSVGIDLARAELSNLVSLVNNGFPSSSISELTEMDGSSLIDTEREQLRSTVCSMESSLTSSESSGRKEDMLEKNDSNVSKLASVELPLMDIHPQNNQYNSGSSNEVKKRNISTISDNVCLEKPQARRSKTNEKLIKAELLGAFDLNTQYQYDNETGSKATDQNFKGIEQVNG